MKWGDDGWLGTVGVPREPSSPYRSVEEPRMIQRMNSAVLCLLASTFLISAAGCTQTLAGPNLGLWSYPLPLSPYFQKREEDAYWNHLRYKRAVILGPLTPGAPDIALPVRFAAGRAALRRCQGRAAWPAHPAARHGAAARRACLAGYRDTACLAALVCHASLGARRRSALDPGTAGSRLPVDDPSLHGGRYRAVARSVSQYASARVTVSA